MHASEVGSQDWWAVVRTMPWQEALQHLNDYRADLMQTNAGTPDYLKASNALTRVNAEIKRINRVIDESRYVKAMRTILPEDLFGLVLQEKRRLEDVARGITP
jgi:hypothetical protein